MDSSYQVDRARMFAAIRDRDHLVFRFATIPQRLFVDFRTSGVDGPAVAILPAASSVKERMATIREVRPAFPRPRRINVVAWPLRVGGLDRLGVIGEIRQRLGDLDAFEALRTLDAAFDSLVAAEEDEVRRAITGEGYKTLWTAPAG